MTSNRQCSRPGCARPAIATLEYDYAQRKAIVGPLQRPGNPHADLCQHHAQRTTVPYGWELTVQDYGAEGFFERLNASDDALDMDDQELWELAESVREASTYVDEAPPEEIPRVSRKREKIPPSEVHPSRRNLPPSRPRRHLRAVELPED